MTTEPQTELSLTPLEDLVDDAPEVSEESIDVPDVVFVSTGSETRDRAIKGIFADAPRLIKEANKVGAWDGICKAVNPAGEAEKFAVAHSGVVEAGLVIPVLKAVKGKLLGLNMSVLQAFNRNRLAEQITRLDMSRFVVIPVVAATVQESQVVAATTTVGITLVDGVLTNVDGKTYKLGQRGRKPLFVLEWEKTNKPADVVIPVVVPGVVLKNGVLTNVDGKTYTIGQRGRKSTWVLEWEKHNSALPVEKKTVATTKPKKTKKVVASDDGFTLKGHTLRSPDGKKYVFGTRGRRADWVKKWMRKNKSKIPA